MVDKTDKPDNTESGEQTQQMGPKDGHTSLAENSPLKRSKSETAEDADTPSMPSSPQNTSMATDSASKKSKKFKKIACTECRQQKAKCDANDTAPNPCTRCVKRNIPCRLDSDFKRTFKRAKIDELVKEYEIIKSRLQINNDLGSLKEQRSQSDSPTLHFQNPSEYNSIMSSSTPGSNAATQQFLPPLQYLQRASNFLNNNYKQTGSPPIPDPNIFHTAPKSTSNNIPLPMQNAGSTLHRNSLPLNKSSISPIPLSTSRSQYSPLAMMNRGDSPMNIDNNSSHGSAFNTFPQQPISSLPTPKYDSLTSNSRINSNYNLTTLISAANASSRQDSENNSNHEMGNYLNWKSHTHSVKRPQVDPSTLICTPKTLGEITLTENQIVILYSTYVTYYHPLLPIIDLNKGIERIYRLCPVLFWTIMLTSLRGHHELSPVLTPSECQSLYFALSPVLKSVLAEISISPITRYAPTEVDEPILNASSVFSVQAFLIYTFWPPLTSSLSADSSWNTVGIAVYQAIRIGLHSPGHTSDRLKSTNKDFMTEQIRTWIGCNIVSQTIGTVFGFPGFFQPYSSLSLTGLEISKPLKQMLEIQTFEEQVEKTLNNNAFDPLRLNHASERLPMIILLENELNQLELRLCSDASSPMDDFRALSLYASRLHLLSYHFQDTEQVPSFELKRGFIKTYNAALAVIQHCKDAQERDGTFVSNLPSAYMLTIWQASVIIARLVNSDYKDILDEESGKALYQVAIALALKASVVKHDLSYRSCGIMKSTWNLFKTLDEDDQLTNLKVNVKSRMSASIFFDTLWILREKCGMIKLRPTKEKSTSESVDSDSDVEVMDDKNTHEVKVNQELIQTVKEARSHSKDSSVSSKKKSYNIESTARRIISTIPLDPQPIGIAETPQDSSSSSKQSSPYLSNYRSPTNPETSIKKIITLQSLANITISQYHSSPTNTANVQTFTEINKIANSLNGTLESTIVPEDVRDANKTPGENRKAAPFLIDSWDVGNEFDSAMLFKDIESVMDEFGFHAEY